MARPASIKCIAKCVACMALVAVSVGWAAPIHAQDPAMPLLLIEGNRYERRTLDEQGRLQKTQELEVGSIRQADGEIEVAVTVIGSDEAGGSTDTVRTTIRCRVENADMVMSVLALVGAEGRRVRVRVTGGEVLYPSSPVAGSLPPVSLEATVEQGVVGFLGGRSRIALRDRTVQPTQGPPAAYTLASRLDLKFYVLGVRVRSQSYRMEEIVTPNRGLARQVLTASDGSSVVLALTD